MLSEYAKNQNGSQNAENTENNEKAEKTEGNEKTESKTEQIKEFGSVTQSDGRFTLHCLTIAGEIEGHIQLPSGTKATRYEHLIPQLVAVEEDPGIDGMLVVLNTVGGDVEAGLALAELIAGMKKPTVSLVLGGGHSIGIPLAVSARYSFIVPSATMTVHPVRTNGLVLGVPQTLNYFSKMQERITDFITGHSGVSAKKLTELMMNTGELATDMGTVLCGQEAADISLINSVGSLSDALARLYSFIESEQKIKPAPNGPKGGAQK